MIICANTEKLVLTVSYCPTYFTSHGAIVEIDTVSGEWKVVQTFQWPSDINEEGCAGSALDTPAVTRDGTTLYLDFVNEFGEVIVLDLDTGKSAGRKSNDVFFVGFENMYFQDFHLRGMTPTVAENGFCSNGCFGWGDFVTKTGHYDQIAFVPFREMADDCHYFDADKNIFYTQAGYDLRDDKCAPVDSDECLLSIDPVKGTLLNAIWTNWTAYKFSSKIENGEILAFIEGFDTLCHHPYDNFLFAMINLEEAKATPIKCIPKDVVVQEGEWLSDFSQDGSVFATASGNADAGEAQLLILNTTTGGVIVKNKLKGLGAALKSVDNLFWIWSIDFY